MDSGENRGSNRSIVVLCLSAFDFIELQLVIFKRALRGVCYVVLPPGHLCSSWGTLAAAASRILSPPLCFSGKNNRGACVSVFSYIRVYYSNTFASVNELSLQ